MVRRKHEEKVDEELIQINTKFGYITLNPAKALTFPYGIVGYSNIKKYCLAAFPGQSKLSGSYLLHSIEAEEKVCFVTFLLVKEFYQDENSLIKRSDINDAVEGLKIAEDDLNMFIIAKLHKINEELKVSINLKAPIFVDLKNKIGYQRVLLKNNYSMNYFIS